MSTRVRWIVVGVALLIVLGVVALSLNSGLPASP
jgi:hypothetical protein